MARDRLRRGAVFFFGADTVPALLTGFPVWEAVVDLIAAAVSL